jgi:proline iminopeptidase
VRLSVNDTELYFDAEGAALVPDGPALREHPTVLVLHGGPGYDHAYFKPAPSALNDVAQIVYLDQRGQGRSAHVSVESCTVEQMADDAAVFCRTLGIERPSVLGHSFGGFVALHLALRHPDLVGSLILVDSAASSADVDGAMERLEELHGPEVRAAAEPVFGGDVSEDAMEAFGRLVTPAYVHSPEKVGPVMETWGRSAFTQEVAEHFFGHLAALYDVRERLGEIGVPTLVLVGESDWLIPPSASRVIAEGIPGAELVVIPDAGHFSLVERPEAYADAVRLFLSTSGSRA